MTTTAKPSKRKKLIDVELAVPVDEAWRALRDPELIKEWFGYYGADYSSWGGALQTLDDEIKAVFTDEATVDERARRITWEGGDEFLLTPSGEGFLLEVFMVRPAPQHELDWKKVYDPICEGWISFVQQLRFFLNRHRNHQRSTIFIAGLSGPQAFEMLRLKNLALIEPGHKYQLQSRTGDRLTGIVWYKTYNQVGLTVNSFGDGLLIAAATPATEDLPDGGCELLITTYLDEERQEELERRWGLAFSAPAQRS